jgi:PAS domain S-box-containing protein
MKNDIIEKELSVSDVQNFNDSLKRLHLVLTQNYDNYQALIEEYLKIGSEIFDLGVGIVSCIEGSEYTVMGTNVTDDSITKGMVFDLEGTYCFEVYKKNESVALTSIGTNSKMCKHPVYVAMKLESYISSPIFVQDKLYGTINFTSLSIREEGFHLYEIEMLELMAMNIGKMLELQILSKEVDKQKNFYEDILNSMHSGYVVQNKSGEIINFNKRSFEILGLTEEELLGKKSIDPEWRCVKANGEPFPGEEHPAMVSLTQNKASKGVIMGVLTPQNTERWISIDSKPLYHDEEGNATHAATTFSDVTDQKKSQELLNRSKQKAERASKTKTEFLANMSHEIRTPLNGIVGMVSILEDTPLDSEQEELLETIQSSSDQLLAVINDILDISKIEAGKTELNEQVFDFRKAISNSFELFKNNAAKNKVELNLNFDENSPSIVLADETKILQITNNLISNAIKFTSNGSVNISVKAEKRAGNTVDINLTVSDSGIGIPKDKRHLLFKAFSQTDESITRDYGGTGLGLIICKKLAELMRGDITFRENRPQGAIFTFSTRIKVSDDELAKVKISEKKIREDLKILVVEDNEVNATVIQRMLKKVNLSMDLAENGELACELVSGKDYDLIFMDLQMPVMDGLTATEKILAAYPDKDIKIIAMTANAFERDRKRCMEVGMIDFVSKPVRKKTLYEVIIKHQS